MFPPSVKGKRLIHAWCNVTYLPTRSLTNEPPPIILVKKSARGKNREQNYLYIIYSSIYYIVYTLVYICLYYHILRLHIRSYIIYVYGRSRTIEEQITNTKRQSSHHDTTILNSTKTKHYNSSIDS